MTVTSKTKDVAVVTAIALALYSTGLFVIFTPLPILYAYIVKGRKEGLISTAICFVVLAAVYVVSSKFAGAENSSLIPVPGVAIGTVIKPATFLAIGLGYFTFFVAIAVTLGEGVRRRFDLIKWGGLALLSGIAVLMIIGAVIWSMDGSGAASALKDQLRAVIGELGGLNQAAGSAGAEAGYIADHADDIASFMMAISPSLIFVFVLIAVVNKNVIGRRFIKGKHVFSHIHNVARFRLPDALVWAVIASGAAFFASRYVFKSDVLEIVAINGLVSLGALYFFQGLAVTAYFLQGIRMPLFRTLAYVAIVLFFQTVGMMIVALGVADVWADFRLRSWRARHGHQA